MSWRQFDPSKVKRTKFSPLRRKERSPPEADSFHLPLRGPAGTGCKQRQMKNNQPVAENGSTINNFCGLYTIPPNSNSDRLKTILLFTRRVSVFLLVVLSTANKKSSLSAPFAPRR
jgi:hypothetical protein